MAEGKDKSMFDAFYKVYVHENYTFYQFRKEFTKEIHAVVWWSVDGEKKETLRTANELGKKHVENVVIDLICEELGLATQQNNHTVDKQDKPLDKQSTGEQAKPKHKVDIEMFVSQSPCNTQAKTGAESECSKRLIAFKNRDDLEVTLKIAIPSLYMIRRKFCEDQKANQGPYNCAQHLELVPEGDSRANQQGLRDMKKAGIQLRTFTDADWKSLADHFKVYQPGTRAEDEKVKRDLEYILSQDDTN